MLYVGIDLGGTAIKAGLLDEKGNIIEKASAPTRVDEGFGTIVSDMARLAGEVARRAGRSLAETSGVGVGIPGVQNPANGRVAYCNNLKWTDVPLIERLGELVGVPCAAENDAAVAALAESVKGASEGVKESVLITLGTGVGGGVIMNGKIHTGCHGVGVEMGHMQLVAGGRKCTCGKRGCWESYASATALILAGKKHMRDNPDGSLFRAVEGDDSRVTPKVIIDMAKEGDASCSRLFRRYAFYVAAGITSIINAYDPEIILLGGGVSQAGDFLLDAVRKNVRELVYCQELPYAKIELARMGNDAGIVGSAMMARDRFS